MIEERRFPLHGVVAIDAGTDAVFLELLAVNIVVAAFALARRRGEVRFDELGLHVGGLVTVNTCGRPVRAHQRIGSLRVVEAREIFPVLGGMTGLAANRRTVRTWGLHVLGELALVRIFVAGLAGQLLPVVEHNRLGLGVRMFRFLMAVGAGNGDMAPG